jgi:signal transduction histidine kinase
VCFKGDVIGDERTSVFEGAKLDVLNPDPPSFHVRFGCFDGQRFNWFQPRPPFYLGWVMEDVTLQAKNGEWWVGSGKGLYRFPVSDNLAQIKVALPLAVYTTKNNLAGPQVFRLFEDSLGNIWISTISHSTNGLARWELANNNIHDLENTPGLPTLKENLPRSFGEDRAGNVWIGFNSGLARYTQGSFKFFTAADGLPPGSIMNIYLDHAGRLWLASARGGLVRIEDPGAQRPSFINYTTEQGLSSNDAEVITEDVYGHIYVGGGNGLDRLDPVTGRIKRFTPGDGLAQGLFRAAFRDQKGALWFGMTHGLSRLVPAPDITAAPPAVLISALRVAGSPRLVSALGESGMTLPDLAANEGQLQLDFVGLSFVPGEVPRYQYKLEGADADWSAPSEQRRVNYANLAPGQYRFLVRAANSDGIFSKAPASVTFTILRPVWQRWWFIALLFMALASIAYAFYRYRLGRVLEMAKLRTRIATDLHDDIGANLTRISLLSEVAKQSLGGNGLEDSPLSSISRIARESVGSMSDIVWAIDPERDTLLDLSRKMRQHADEVFTLRDIELHFNAPGASESLRLGVDVRRDLLLIFKEAVNNAARHSRCTEVGIDLRVHASRLLLEITDNGVGFDRLIESEGQGLRSMKRRAAALRGTLEINTDPGVQTIIRISIPVARAHSVS